MALEMGNEMCQSAMVDSAAEVPECLGMPVKSTLQSDVFSTANYILLLPFLLLDIPPCPPHHILIKLKTKLDR